MGTTQGLPRQGRQGRRGHRALTIVTYVVLVALGAVQGLIGSFQYSRGPVPLIAIVLALAIFLTCLLCGWGMRSVAGGLAPAIGWVVAAFLMSMPNSHGSVIVTATSAGEWFLYGGAFAAAGGAAITFLLWARAQYRRR